MLESIHFACPVKTPHLASEQCPLANKQVVSAIKQGRSDQAFTMDPGPRA